jgi:hypothetical protein
LYEKSSIDRYLADSKQFICYKLSVLGLDEAKLQRKHGFGFTLLLLSRLEALLEQLQDKNKSEADFEEEFLQVSVGFWVQRLEASQLQHFIRVGLEKCEMPYLKEQFEQARNLWRCVASYSSTSCNI